MLLFIVMALAIGLAVQMYRARHPHGVGLNGKHLGRTVSVITQSAAPKHRRSRTVPVETAEIDLTRRTER